MRYSNIKVRSELPNKYRTHSAALGIPLILLVLLSGCPFVGQPVYRSTLIPVSPYNTGSGTIVFLDDWGRVLGALKEEPESSPSRIVLWDQGAARDIPSLNSASTRVLSMSGNGDVLLGGYSESRALEMLAVWKGETISEYPIFLPDQGLKIFEAHNINRLKDIVALALTVEPLEKDGSSENKVDDISVLSPQNAQSSSTKAVLLTHAGRSRILEGLPGSVRTDDLIISDLRVVTGSSKFLDLTTLDSGSVPTVWEPPFFEPRILLPDLQGEPTSLNLLGHVTGYTPGGSPQSWVVRDGRLHDLDIVEATFNVAFRVNNSGDVLTGHALGESPDHEFKTLLWRWNPHTDAYEPNDISEMIRPIDQSIDPSMFGGITLNNRGQIVLSSSVSSTQNVKTFLLTPDFEFSAREPKATLPRNTGDDARMSGNR